MPDLQRTASPKPLRGTQARLKARGARHQAKARKACREARYVLDGGCCVRCGVPLKLNPSDEGADWFNVANIHEKIPRSLGGSATDVANTETLCAGCHTGTGRHAK